MRLLSKLIRQNLIHPAPTKANHYFNYENIKEGEGGQKRQSELKDTKLMSYKKGIQSQMQEPNRYDHDRSPPQIKI